MADLVERLEKRAEEDQACAENSAAVFAALGEQYRAFDERNGTWNTYAVRLAVDHKKSAERDAQYAADLNEAASTILRLQEENARLRERLEIDPGGGDAIDAAESAAGFLRHRISALEVALAPFQTDWADENGWTDHACQNDRIVDWFGPSDFMLVRSLIKKEDDHANTR